MQGRKVSVPFSENEKKKNLEFLLFLVCQKEYRVPKHENALAFKNRLTMRVRRLIKGKGALPRVGHGSRASSLPFFFVTLPFFDASGDLTRQGVPQAMQCSANRGRGVYRGPEMA